MRSMGDEASKNDTITLEQKCNLLNKNRDYKCLLH